MTGPGPNAAAPRWYAQVMASPAVFLLLLLSFASLPGADAPTPSGSPGSSAPAPSVPGPKSGPGDDLLPPGTPPSPSSVPGIRIWPEPCFTTWPAVAYADETRNVAFTLPNQHPGLAGAIGWSKPAMMPITMPAEGDSASGLLPLDLGIGLHQALVQIGTASWTMRLRVVDVRQPWPLARLQEGFPVDADGVPVVLLDRRRHAEEERRWESLRAALPRPTGRAILVGDPMEALGRSAWDGLDAERRVAFDQRYPHHAVLVALAALGQPRTIIWSPGNQPLYGAGWSPEEERVLAVIRSHFEALGIRPNLVLVAPPVPLEDTLKARAAERRELLIDSASAQGWIVIDAEPLLGPAEIANRVQDGLFTRYACGEAHARLGQALAQELAR